MHQLDRDTQLIPIDSKTYTARISAHWSINGTPNGGYLMALMARAMREQCRMEKTIIFTVSYMARCTFEPAVIRLERISATSNFERWEARLMQREEVKVLALGTFSTNKNDAENMHESGPPDLPPIEQCTAIPAMDQYTLFQQMDVRLTPESAGWFENKLSQRSEIKGWIKFHSQRIFDPLAILLMADAFPPPVMSSQGMVAWVPTLELSVCLRNTPSSHWLKGVFRTRHITAGILEEDGELWDQSDNLVAVSRQIAQFRRSSS